MIRALMYVLKCMCSNVCVLYSYKTNTTEKIIFILSPKSISDAPIYHASVNTHIALQISVVLSLTR